jgi:hypothetical protein
MAEGCEEAFMQLAGTDQAVAPGRHGTSSRVESSIGSRKPPAAAAGLGARQRDRVAGAHRQPRTTPTYSWREAAVVGRQHHRSDPVGASA